MFGKDMMKKMQGMQAQMQQSMATMQEELLPSGRRHSNNSHVPMLKV